MNHRLILGLIFIVVGIFVLVKNIFFKKNVSIEDSFGGICICSYLISGGILKIIFDV